MKIECKTTLLPYDEWNVEQTKYLLERGLLRENGTKMDGTRTIEVVQTLTMKNVEQMVQNGLIGIEYNGVEESISDTTKEYGIDDVLPF